MMKSKNVISKTLSLLLTVLLAVMSLPAISLTASADGDTVINGKSLITFEGGTVPDGVTLDAQGSTSITAAPAAGHGDYSLKHTWTSANTTILRTRVNFLAGHTYQISLSYYYEAPTEEEAATYMPWFILFASGTSIGDGVWEATYGQWKSFTRTYTPDADKTCLDIIANKVNGYYDDIMIRDITYQTKKQNRLYAATNFADVDTDLTAFLIPGANTNVTYEYDEELSKNVAAVSFPGSSANISSMICFPYLLKRGTTYSLTLTYKSDKWCCLSYDADSFSGGAAGFNESNTYITITRTFTPAANRCAYLGTTTQHGAVNMTISEVILKEVAADTNTAAYQEYDFDFIRPTNVANANTFSLITGSDGKLSQALKVVQNDTRFRFNYALTQYQVYHIAFDYQGSASVRVLPNTGGWNNGMFSAYGRLSRTTSDFSISSGEGEWAHFSSYFVAETAATQFWFRAVERSASFYLDNFVIEIPDDASCYSEDFEDGSAFERGLTNYSTFNVAASPTTDSRHGDYGLLHTKTNNYEKIDIASILLADHSYAFSFDYFADTSVAASQSYYLSLLYTSDARANYTTITGFTTTNNWCTYSSIYTPEETGILSINIADQIYLDNISIVDITDTLINNLDYYEDFSNPNGGTLIATKTNPITYGEEDGKPVGTISFVGNADYTVVPFYLKDDVDYRISITYKSDVWVLPYYNGTYDASNGLTTKADWYTWTLDVTGSGANDLFKFSSNNATGTFTIANITIFDISDSPASPYAGHTLTLDGDIGTNFFAYAVSLDSSDTVKFAWGTHETDPVSLSSFDTAMVGGRLSYKLSCNVAAKEMTDTITATITHDAAEVTEDYSVAQYANTVITAGTPTYSQPLVDLMEAMLIYGAKAQIQFNYNTGSLADSSLDSYTLPEIDASDLTTYTYKTAGAAKTALANCGLSYVGTTLVLKSKASYRLFFALADEETADAASVTLGGNALEFENFESEDHSRFRIFTIPNIAAAELLDDLAVSFNGTSVNFNIGTYIAKAISKNDTVLKNVLNALYLYNQKAVEYFG